jgi:phosphate transport system permease protein
VKPQDARFRPRIAARKRKDAIMKWVFGAAAFFGVAVLAGLLVDVFADGFSYLTWDFLTSFPSRRASQSGLLSALAGSAWLMLLTVPLALPVGIATAIYLEEFAPKGRFASLLETNIRNLAGVPSVVYGMLGLAVFVRFFGFDRTILAGACTLALMSLPVIIVNAQEAIRAVPDSLRHASLAMGATKWQMVRTVVLPSATSGILTGTILAMSRAIGETAPLILAGAAAFVAFTPEGPLSRYTALPIQIWVWISKPQEEFRSVAAAGIIVLLALLLTMNALAIWLRIRYQRRSQG